VSIFEGNSCNDSDSSSVDAAYCYGVCVRLAGQIHLVQDSVCREDLSLLFIYLLPSYGGLRSVSCTGDLAESALLEFLLVITAVRLHTSSVLSRVWGSVTNNDGFWIRFIGNSITIIVSYSSSQSMNDKDSVHSVLDYDYRLFHCY
jgi:hypothetical protein